MGRVVVVMVMLAAFACSCASTSSNGTSVVTPQPKLAGLAILLPADLDPTVDCASSKDPTPKGFTQLLDQLNCVEGKASQIAGGYLDGYLFGSADALATSFDAINVTYHFFPGSAGPKCPPARGAAEGRLAWHQGAALGTLECYDTSDGGHVYIWTNEPDHTLFFAKVGKSISYATLHEWWTHTGCCSRLGT